MRDDLLRPEREQAPLPSSGSASASSSALVCSELAPPSTAAIACSAVRDHVVVRLLGRKRHPRCLRVEPELPGTFVARPVTIAHHRGPHLARCAVLRDLLEEVVLRVEEERDPRSERIDVQSCVSMPYCTYSIPSRSVNASSCSAVAPASRMW